MRIESCMTTLEASPNHTMILDLIDGKEKQADG
jgi:hypothetical protein